MTADELTEAAKVGSIEPEEFLKEIWNLSVGHQRAAPIFGAEKVDLYRALHFNENERPKLTSDLSYPPLDKVRLGRANCENEQVFYASVGQPTTLPECRAKVGDFLVLGKWVSRSAMALQKVGFRDDNDGLENLYQAIFTARGESCYRYSSRVASHLMTGPEISGLLYPSMVSAFPADNIVLKKSFADAHLVLRYATALKVLSIVSESVFVASPELDFAKPSANGELHWTGRKRIWPCPTGVTLDLIGNGWEWNAYLPNGTYIEPE